MPRSQRVKEAPVLATKVSAHPATIAELCWSDDPEYITGYVTSK
jgi:6-carboxyhexanoate--CoA ligase